LIHLFVVFIFPRERHTVARIAQNVAVHLPPFEYLLQRVLSYHIVPSITFFSDYVYNHATSSVVQPHSVDTDVSVDIIRDLFDGLEYEFFYPQTDEEILAGSEDMRIQRGWTVSLPPRVNITHYSLPTLYGENDHLNVSVVQYKKTFGHGAIARRIYVSGGYSQDEDASSGHGHGHKKQVASVIFKDAPAKGGSIQIINDVLVPPPGFYKP